MLIPVLLLVAGQDSKLGGQGVVEAFDQPIKSMKQPMKLFWSFKLTEYFIRQYIYPAVVGSTLVRDCVGLRPLSEIVHGHQNVAVASFSLSFSLLL